MEYRRVCIRAGTPILTGGLKVVPWAVPAKDAQLAELQKLSAERICWAYGIPLQLLGLGSQPFSSTEALMRFWLSNGLGFALNHCEEAIGQLFNLEGQPIEYLEFSTDALLRSDPKDRIEMLARGVQGGIFSPNEARNMESLDSVPFGDGPRCQSQVVPLSAASAIPTAPVAAVSPAAPAVTQDYRAAVERDIAALRTRGAKRPQRIAALNGKGKQRRPVTGKARRTGCGSQR
jgi:hypothetical protein